MAEFGLWSGGLRLSSNAGEQYVSGLDDFVESEIDLKSSWLGAIWFARLKAEMEALKKLASALFGCVASYYKTMKADGAGAAAKASDAFWQSGERIFPQMVEACGSDGVSDLVEVRRKMAKVAEVCFDELCPRSGARQIEAWAAHRIATFSYVEALQEGQEAASRSKRGGAATSDTRA
jgi:CRISPR system Cascade subunit CasA